MEYVFLTPSWFFLYSILLEVFFAVITLIISIYGFKVYSLTEQKQLKTFSIAFLFISFSYLIQSVLNLIILSNFDDEVILLINLNSVYLLNLFGLYAHALFFITGLFLLTYITLKVENKRIMALFLSVLLLSVLFSVNKVFLFYVLSSVLLIFTVWHYFSHYIQKKNINTLLVLLAMIFLLFGTLHLMYAVKNEIYYVIGHILEFIAYMLLLVNLLIIVNYGKKKR